MPASESATTADSIFRFASELADIISSRFGCFRRMSF
jgi:hypothetical protein